MTVWDVLIWGGAGLAALGLAGIVWCIAAVLGARRRALDDAAMRAVMRRVVAVNMAALAASMLGLMAVVLGIMLGR
ncbi:hypothetical protein [Paracoccus sanguinis]|uniref:Uncharacterized protein n=1 Tax=Paracoccus sanguinis TaxID=1545044 RepID=A0A099G6E2_9RHOB|nr:hypothetical protein [Paracoccus sanguinis]KGJ16127.1 hypothetical protein IX57_13630 [Paracoccus sanguinis]KGJ18191.1 hypothetical protein IX55_11880 [Paracoccus sanguinis]QJD15546.1 hypothetical protein HGN31_00505 [Paracoccus sanguinis]SDX20816.1 hypothetical protein SAMN05444276_103223 [Paracoccus sanguinis]